MNIAEWCIRNNRTTLVLIAIIIFSGVFTFLTMSRNENPKFTIRLATIITPFPGASPQRVEELVSDKLEEKIREIPEVEFITSQNMNGVSIIKVNVWEKYKDMVPVWNKLRNKVDDALPDLPPEAGTPVINDEYGDVFGILVAVTGDGYTMREIEDWADIVRDDLLKVPGSGKVVRWGRQAERIFINFSASKFSELGVNPFQLAKIIDAQNTIRPSGDVKVGAERLSIEPTGTFQNVDELKELSVRLPGQNESIALDSLVDISRDYADPPIKPVHYNGERCVMLAVSMAKGGNIMDLGDSVTAELEILQKRMPVGLELNMFVYQPEFVAKSVNDFTLNLMESFAFVVAVMLIFAGLKTGIIAGLLVPMAMLACIALMPAMGVGLQGISIASLIISLGILVDNGVVVSENILVRLASGQERLKAVTEAVSELWMPLLAASLTTVFAFLPIPLAPSATGEYTSSLFVVVTLALFSSWVLALTFVPMLCFYILKPEKRVQEFLSKPYLVYRKLLLLVLRHRPAFLVVVVGLCVFSVWGFKYVPKMFFPPNERPQFLMDFWQPYGTDITTTEARVSQLEKFLLDDPATESVGSFIGAGGPRWYLPLTIQDNNKNYASIVVNTHDIEEVDALIERTHKELALNFPDVSATIKKLRNGPPVGAPIQIRISGSDIKELYELRDYVVETLRANDDITRVWDDWGQWAKKIVVDVDQDRARRAGVSSSDVANSLQLQMTGVEATVFREGDKNIPVVLRTQEKFRSDMDRFGSMAVYPENGGENVPLLQVGEPAVEWQPSNIRRRDQTRTITVKADIRTGAFPSIVLGDVKPILSEYMASEEWPEGYKVAFGGEFEKSDKASGSIRQNLPLALGLLVLVLVAQFNSLRRPAIILLTVPPMFVGITWGMLATSSPFGFMAMLGMISLLGIIVNNAIMLIDRIEGLRSKGLELQDAIVVAALQRARPIIMTTVTTIIGMVPLSLQGGEMWRPMANCIMSGLAFATVLTLLLCPVLYSLFFRAGFKKYNWRQTILQDVQE
ncbi:MAG: efflux RND transporter permease subunit [Desulfovibrio sp.]